ncbi:MAG: protein kinase [Anaerolineales bacterium]|nr:protein kinase [Anaerolineales bacterium]
MVHTSNLKGYQIIDQIGSGGNGVVYRAYQPVVGREVAIKVIGPEYANQPHFIRRFDFEAQVIARLEHPFIVPLYDYWREPNGAYLVMRWLKGGHLQSQTYGARDVLAILEQIAAALTTAHQHHVIHRDVKPTNILLDEIGNAYLSDFGIASATGDTPTETQGTIAYLAPEQLQQHPISPQTDIYSLGLVAYEILTGKHPFGEIDSAAYLLHHLTKSVPNLEAYGFSSLVDSVIQRATHKTPSARFETTMGFVYALRDALNLGTPYSIQTSFATKEIRNPYKGLRSFKETDKDDFFGRGRLIQEIVHTLEMQTLPFLTLVGPSGCGKSSIVQAGIIPALRHKERFVLEMVPSSDPIQELAAVLLSIASHPYQELLEELQSSKANKLEQIIEKLVPDDSDIFLFIDQFEEVFTLVASEAERIRFIDLITQAASRLYGRLHIIIALRADFYDRPLLYPQLAGLVSTNTIVIPVMTVEETQEAILSPASQVGVQLEPALIARIVNEVQNQPGTLPLLQYSLTELFDQRENNLLTLTAYQNIGGVSGAAAKRADELYLSLDADRQKATRQIFLRLVSLGDSAEDTRQRVRRSELGIQSNILQDVLMLFGRYRLLTFDHEPSTRAPTIEIAHESLIKAWGRLRTWLNDNREDLQVRRRLTSATFEWLNAGHDSSFLASGSRLEQFIAWSETSEVLLNEDEQSYLNASITQRKRSEMDNEERRRREIRLLRRAQQRLWGIVVVLLAAVVVAGLLMGWALREQRTAKQNAERVAITAATAARNADEAQSLALSTSSQQALNDNNPDLAIALALAANAIPNPSSQAQRALAEAIYSTGTQSRRLLPTYSGARMTNITIGSSGRTVLMGYDDRVMRLWDMNNGKLLWEFAGHDALIYSLAYSPGGRTAMAGTGVGTIFVWDLTAGALIGKLEQHTSPVTALVYHIGGRLVLSGSEDGEIILWSLFDNQIIMRFNGHRGAISQLVFSPDNRTILSGSVDNTIRLWDMATGAELKQIIAHDNIGALAISPTGNTIASGYPDAQIELWDMQASTLEYVLRGHTAAINDLDFDDDGQFLISGANDGLLIIWDVAAGKEVRRLVGHTGSVWQVDFLRSNEQTALSISSDGSMRWWDTERGAQLKQLSGHGAEITSVAFSPDGQRAVSGGHDRIAIIWNLETGEIIHTLVGHTDWVQDVAFSPDGTSVVSGSVDGTIRLWDTETGKSVRQFVGHTREVNSVTFSPDGKWLASGSSDNTIRLWDIETGQTIRVLAGHTAQVKTVAFSPDGNQLLSVSLDGSIRLWDVTSGVIQATLQTEIETTTVAFNPRNPQQILSGSTDGIVRLWDTETGYIFQEMVGHTGPITAVAFNPNGETVLSASRDRSVRLWDVRSGDEIARFDGHLDAVLDVAFSSDSRTALSASRDRTIRLWRTFQSLDEMVEFATNNRYIRELTCLERTQYRVLPLCPTQ